MDEESLTSIWGVSVSDLVKSYSYTTGLTEEQFEEAVRMLNEARNNAFDNYKYTAYPLWYRKFKKTNKGGPWLSAKRRPNGKD